MSITATISPWFQPPAIISAKNQQAVIIGAGLAGCCAAAALCKRGWSVTLIEQHGKPAQESSGNRTAVVQPLLDLNDSPARRWHHAGFAFTSALLPQLSLNTWQRCGIFISSGETSALTRLKKIVEQKLTITMRWCDPVDTGTICGTDLPSSGLFLEEGGHLNPAELCHALLKRHGTRINLLFQQQATTLGCANGIWSIVAADAKLLAQAPVVIIANGTGTGRFSQTCDLPLPVTRGQLSNIAATAKSSALRCIISAARSITPAYESYHSIAASYSRSNLSSNFCQHDHDDNLAKLADICPDLIADLAGQPYHGRAAFRTGSPDHLPIVGAIPNLHHYHELYKVLHHGHPASRYPTGSYYPGLFVSAAHGSRGLTSAPLAAELLAKMINNEPLDDLTQHVAALHPARFLIRRLQRGLG